jgi:hypothetical protein
MTMDKAAASELVAERFSRMMNATTSPAGVAGDPPVVAAVTAVFLLSYLAARQSDAPPGLQQVLLVLVFVPTAVALVVALALLGARSRVVAWLAGLPFPLENLNAILNGLGDGLEITFKSSVPETAAVNALLDGVHTDCFVTDAKDQVVVVRIGVVDNKRNPAASNYRRYRRTHELIDRVILPLHKDHPIETVRVR